MDDGSSTLGDVDGDGNPDLVITGLRGFNRTTTLYLGDGSGGFREANAGLTGVGFGSSSTLGDVDEDGDLDLVVTGLDALFGASSARVYVNRTVQEPPNQDPVFARFPEPFAVAPGHTVTRLVEAGDADGDPLSLTQGGSVDGVSVTDAGNGVAEIAFTPSRSQAGQSFTVSVEASDGNGGTATGSVTVEVGDEFAPLDAGLTGVVGGSSTLGDVDGDGHLDLVITGSEGYMDPTTTVYLGDGSGGFSEANAGLTGVDDGSSTLGDVDGDGNLDLVITGTDQNDDPTSTLYENLSSQNYQVASVTQPVSGDGTTAFGDTGVEIRFAASTSGSGDVTVQRFSNGPSVPRGIPEDNVSSYRFVISAGGGDLTVGDGTEVRLDVSTLEGIGDASNVTVYKRSVRGRGPFAALSTSHDGAENELVAETDAFSEFVLASNTEPLPVELVSFGANTTDDEEAAAAAVLRWTTASEISNAGFAVQHRADSTGAWEQLGFVESKAPGGTSPEAQTYRFRTEALEVGTHGFRLQQVDTDGTAHVVSRVVQARVSMEEAFHLTSHPNPVQRQATVKVAVKTEQEVQLRLYDVLGRRLATLYDGPLPAQESRAMPLRPDDLGLSSGAYFLRLVGEERTRTRRLTVVR